MKSPVSWTFLYLVPIALLIIGSYQLVATNRPDVGLVFVIIAIVLLVATYLYQRRRRKLGPRRTRER